MHISVIMHVHRIWIWFVTVLFPKKKEAKIVVNFVEADVMLKRPYYAVLQSIDFAFGLY